MERNRLAKAFPPVCQHEEANAHLLANLGITIQLRVLLRQSEDKQLTSARLLQVLPDTNRAERTGRDDVDADLALPAKPVCQPFQFRLFTEHQGALPMLLENELCDDRWQKCIRQKQQHIK